MNKTIVPYKDNGKVVENAYIILFKKIGKNDVDGLSQQNYLEISKKLLADIGYNIKINKVTYTDTKTGKLVKGSILFDKNDKDIYYHFIINGHLPSFKHGGENPLLKRVNMGDSIKIIKHKRDLPFIKSSEFKIKK